MKLVVFPLSFTDGRFIHEDLFLPRDMCAILQFKIGSCHNQNKLSTKTGVAVIHGAKPGHRFYSFPLKVKMKIVVRSNLAKTL
jgi:hypothetical protein